MKTGGAGAAIAAMLAALSSARAGETSILTADQLPPALLAACEARAAALDRAEPAIATSAAALTAIGALAPEDFDGVRIGFCPMRRESGPVGATSCRDDIILLDEKYRAPREALVLHATLAHEITHVRQHRAKKASLGAAWCDSAAFRAAKEAHEAAADEFGDKAAALIALGREIEIINDCDAPLLVYAEAVDPVPAGGVAAFERARPHGAAVARDRALSGRVLYYAETAPASGPKRIFTDPKSSQSRFVDGRLVRLAAARLSAPDRLTSPFRLRLSCASDRE